MKQKPWNPPAAAAGANITSFDAAAKFDVTDPNRSSPLSIIGALYIVIGSLRSKTPVQVSLDGQDLFVYDGHDVQQTAEFAALLQQFEFCILQERRAGYSDALDWVDEKLKADPQNAGQQVADARNQATHGDAQGQGAGEQQRAEGGQDGREQQRDGQGDDRRGQQHSNRRRR